MAVKADSKEGFPGFEPVTEQIWVQRGDNATATTEAPAGDQPTTVLLFGWGNGQPRHVAKYTAGFRALYPQATIVAVLSPILQAIRHGVEQRTQAMRPLVDLVYGAQNPRREDERVLVHVMSNGGGIFYAAALNAHGQMQRERQGEGEGEDQDLKASTAMPHDLLVCDSTPGGDSLARNLWMWARAMALGAASFFPWPFAVTQVLCAGVLLANHVTEFVFARTSAATFSRRIVNDPAAEPLAARRLYLYSEEDDIIRWQDIVAHAADARQVGYDVALERFAGSPHVGHMRHHPEQYWRAIAQSWTRAHSSR